MAQVFPLLHGENVRTMKGMVRIGGIGMGGVCAVFMIVDSRMVPCGPKTWPRWMRPVSLVLKKKLTRIGRA